jgi:hypothetical protein
MNLRSIVFVLMALSLTNCATVPSRIGMGLWYTNVKDYTNVEYINGGTSKAGKSCGTNILGLIATGNTSIDAAKKKGGITKVATVDFEGTSILGLYSTTCLVVRGE